MYSRGVPASVIAVWCRVDVRRVHRAVDKQNSRHPGLFDRCWRIHDQPAPARNTRRYVRTWEQAWWEHYDDVAAYMRERGGALPAQNDSPKARVLYRWIEAQRRQYDTGTLAPGRIDALDRLGEWVGTRKGVHLRFNTPSEGGRSGPATASPRSPTRLRVLSTAGSLPGRSRRFDGGSGVAAMKLTPLVVEPHS
ncbi:helicase associated domain-containing protein [Arthrobacter sp. MDT3-44]